MHATHASPNQDLPATELTEFIRFCERAASRRFVDYIEFEIFTIQNYRQFWRCFLDWSGIAYSGDPNPVCTAEDCEHAEFFPNLRLNLVENLLPVRDAKDAARPALTSLAPARDPVRLTRGELRSRVGRLTSSLQALGVSPQWRIAMVAQSAMLLSPRHSPRQRSERWWQRDRANFPAKPTLHG